MTIPENMTSETSMQYQLDEWVQGRSWHNTVRDECCPDFSCCNKEMNTPLDERKRFAEAVNSKDEGTQNKMLMIFMGAAMSTLKKDTGVDVHIAGDEASYGEVH